MSMQSISCTNRSPLSIRESYTYFSEEISPVQSPTNADVSGRFVLKKNGMVSRISCCCGMMAALPPFESLCSFTASLMMLSMLTVEQIGFILSLITAMDQRMHAEMHMNSPYSYSSCEEYVQDEGKIIFNFGQDT